MLFLQEHFIILRIFVLEKKTVLVIIMINSIENIHAITYSLQVSPEIVNESNVVCNNTDMDQCGEFCICTHVIKLASKKVTQIVLLNESKNVLLFEYIHITCEYPLLSTNTQVFSNTLFM